MKTYIGTKIVNAEPSDAWQRFGAHAPDSPGYKVVYLDGYISWSPKDTFEEVYREMSGLTFGMAIEAMRKGCKVARAGWNGKGMWLMLVLAELADKVAFEYAALSALPWIGMKTADEKFVPWLASQTDMLAEDWFVV